MFNIFRNLIIFIFIYNSEGVFAQGMFHMLYGGKNGDSGHSVLQTIDGGYVIVGETLSLGQGLYDVFLIKADISGDIVWTKTFGGSDSESGFSVEETYGGGYIIGGSSYGFGAGDHDFYLIKTDSLGDMIWAKTYGGNGIDVCYSVIQTQDSGYLLTGTTSSFGNAHNVYVVKTDVDGNLLWAKAYGTNGHEEGVCGIQTRDGGYIFLGLFGSSLIGDCDIYLIKTDDIGNVVWSKTYGGAAIDYALDISQNINGEYLIAGSTNSFGAGNYDAYILRTDSVGAIIWSKVFGDSLFDYAQSISQVALSEFVIKGGYGTNHSTANICLFNADSTGNVVWAKTYGHGGANTNGSSMKPTSDGGFVIVDNGICLIKTDLFGNSKCDEVITLASSFPATKVTNISTITLSTTTITTNTATAVGSGGSAMHLCSPENIYDVARDNAFTLFPNPTSDILSISCNNNNDSNTEIAFYNSFGQELFHKSFSCSTTIDISQLVNGIYMYKLKSIYSGVKNGKVVKH